jgi:four helix bundle protein
MGNIKSFKDLIIWQKAIDLAVEVYQLTKVFPKEEMFGLTNQLRRAACSISLNIAEGYGRNTTKSYINSLYIAEGSLRELESGLILSTRLNFLAQEEFEKINSVIIE